jgi:hypothetical protein
LSSDLFSKIVLGSLSQSVALQANDAPLLSPSIVVPAAIALVALLVTNIVVLLKIRLDIRTNLKRDLTLQEIARLKERLQQFYDPLVALTQLNAAMTKKLGRDTFPMDSHLKEDALLVWNSVVENVILPTNRKICTIIKECSHLIDSTDQFEQYMNFILHAESYEIFTKQRNEIHKKFLYPKDFDIDLQRARAKVIKDLEEAERNIGNYLIDRRY